MEKFEDDLEGHAFPKGRRRARVVFGEPIDVAASAGARTKVAAGEVTDRLEETIRGLMAQDPP